MKLMLCEECMELVVPSSAAGVQRWCRCRNAVCWWDDPALGQFVMWCRGGPQRVSGIGLHNGLLQAAFQKLGDGSEYGVIQRNVLQQIIDDTPDTYLFKHLNSLVLRFRAGFTNDVRFAKDEEVQ